jgi:hypothetical protein
VLPQVKQLTEKGKKMVLTRYRVTLGSDYKHRGLFLPFEHLTVANNEEAAIRKTRYQAKKLGIKTNRVISIEIDSVFEMVQPN